FKGGLFRALDSAAIGIPWRPGVLTTRGLPRLEDMQNKVRALTPSKMRRNRVRPLRSPLRGIVTQEGLFKKT
ncbi:UNVERIFIED_CONTAM: hypothetical protein Sindi_1660700, partial [Sesamum indicum]